VEQDDEAEEDEGLHKGFERVEGRLSFWGEKRLWFSENKGKNWLGKRFFYSKLKLQRRKKHND